jgi:hypothetical protein
MPGWSGRYTSKDRTFANKAIPAHICRGCLAWFDGAKPAACKMCGRMDFEDFKSGGEAKWWMKLLRRVDAGVIRDLRREVSIDLLTVNHRTGKPVVWGRYVADFQWVDVKTGNKVVAECKPGGDLTYESQLKLRCVEAMGIPVEALT